MTQKDQTSPTLMGRRAPPPTIKFSLPNYRQSWLCCGWPRNPLSFRLETLTMQMIIACLDGLQSHGSHVGSEQCIRKSRRTRQKRRRWERFICKTGVSSPSSVARSEELWAHTWLEAFKMITVEMESLVFQPHEMSFTTSVIWEANFYRQLEVMSRSRAKSPHLGHSNFGMS